jgi:hypothetical protein
VTTSSAAQLACQHAADLIQGKIEVFDALREKGDRRISRNPAGFLVQSVRQDYSPPAGLGQIAIPSRAKDTPAKSKPRRPRGKAAQGTFHVGPSPVVEILACLSMSERVEREASAVMRTHGIPADGYRRALAANNAALAEKFRQVILEQHLRQSVKKGLCMSTIT